MRNSELRMNQGPYCFYYRFRKFLEEMFNILKSLIIHYLLCQHIFFQWPQNYTDLVRSVINWPPGFRPIVQDPDPKEIFADPEPCSFKTLSLLMDFFQFW
jgi:hypothetical protein